MANVSADSPIHPSNISGNLFWEQSNEGLVPRVNLQFEDIDFTVYSLYARNLETTKEAPELGWFDRFYWVPLKLSEILLL